MKSAIFNLNSKFIDYILIYALIFISSDSLFFATSSEGLSKFIILPLYIFISFLFFRYAINSKNYSKLAFIFIFYCTLTILITALINLDFSLGYGYQLLVLISGFYIVTRNSKIQLTYEKFSNSIILLAALSFPLYTIASFLPNLIDAFPKGTNQANIEYATYYLSSVFLDQKDLRNISIFREAGAFSVYLIFSLIYELFIRPTIKIAYLLILIVAILTTKSTTGYFALIIIFLPFVFIPNVGAKKILNVNRNLIFFPLIILACFFVVTDTNSNVFTKLSSDSVDYGSTLARSASFFVNLEIFMLSPLWGVGLKDYQVLFSSISSSMYGLELNSESQSTNTFMSILSVYGITPCFIYLFSIFNFTKIANSNIFARCSISLALFFILSSQDMRYSVLSAYIFTCGILLSKNKYY